MDSLTTWEYNGVSLELNLQDVETAERYEAAFDEMAAREKTFPKDGRSSEIFRAYCEMMYGLFDAIFGEGTSKKLCGDRLDAGACTEAYDSFLAFVSKQATHAAERRASVVTKYSANRAQRRAKK